MKLKNKVMITVIAINQIVLTSVFAETNTAQIDILYNWLLDWLKKGGVGVVIFGLGMCAFAHNKNDSHQMEGGIKTVITGVMLATIDVVVKQFM